MNEIETARCPICNGDNGCARISDKPIETCWCVSRVFPQEVLDAVPLPLVNKACICQACVDQAERRKVDSHE